MAAAVVVGCFLSAYFSASPQQLEGSRSAATAWLSMLCRSQSSWQANPCGSSSFQQEIQVHQVAASHTCMTVSNQSNQRNAGRRPWHHHLIIISSHSKLRTLPPPPPLLCTSQNLNTTVAASSPKTATTSTTTFPPAHCHPLRSTNSRPAPGLYNTCAPIN